MSNTEDRPLPELMDPGTPALLTTPVSPLCVEPRATPAPAAAAAVAAAAHSRTAPAAAEAPAVGEGGCPQREPQSCGLNVLVGAVDIELRANRTTSAAEGAAAAAAAAAVSGATDPASKGGSGSRSSPSCPMDLEKRSVGAPGDENEEEEVACRSLKTVPHGFVEQGNAPTAEGTCASALPGFSAISDVVLPAAAAMAASAPPNTAVASSLRKTRMADFVSAVVQPPAASSLPSTAAGDSSRRMRMIDYVSAVTPPAASPPPPPPLLTGPSARDTYAELMAATERAAAAAAAAAAATSPVLAPGASPIATAAPAANTAAAVKSVTTKAAKPTAAVATPRKAAAKTKTVKKPSPKEKVKKRRARNGAFGHSHFKGVCITPAGSWRAVIYVDRRQKYLGVFDSEFDAARAYDAAAKSLFPADTTPPLNNPDVIERQLYEISSVDGRPFATAGAPQLPDFEPSVPSASEPAPGLQPSGSRMRV